MPRDPFEEIMQSMSVDERKFIREQYNSAFKDRLSISIHEVVTKEVRKLMKEMAPGLKEKIRTGFVKNLEKETDRLLKKALKNTRVNISSHVY